MIGPQARKNLRLLFVSIVVSLAASEVLLSLFLPIDDPYAYRKQSRPKYIASEFPPHLGLRTEAEPGLPGLSGTRNFSTNNLGFRGEDLGAPKPEGEFRVFLVGGSAAECLYLDDSESLNAVLQASLQRKFPDRRVKVYNAGKSGDRSYDHIAMVVHRILHLQPDAVVVFAGVNDLLAAMHHTDYLHRAPEAKRTLTLPVLLKLLSTEFQIPRYVYFSKRRGMAEFAAEDEELEVLALNTNYAKLVKRSQSRPSAEGRPETDIASYKTNLRTLAGALAANGAKAVFMTQPSSWNSAVDPRTREWHWMLFGHREEDMDAALGAYNEAMKEVAAERSIPVFDAAEKMPKSLEFFYDDVHFNVSGAQKAGEELAAYF